MTLNDESQVRPQGRTQVKRERALIVAGVVLACLALAAVTAVALGVDLAALFGR